MKGIDVAGVAVVVGFFHTLLTATGAFVEVWVGSTVGYACVFVVVRTAFGATYHGLVTGRPADRGADVSTRETGDA